MSEEFNYVGKRIPKLDAPDKATGRTVYPQDLKLPRMLHGKILWSEHPHARILSIDTAKARELPGVKAVITHHDLPDSNCGFMKDNPPLKREKVRSMRDEVAAVAAVSEEIAEKALALIGVEYEELPAVFDPEEARRPDAPLVHENLENNLVDMQYHFKYGDVEEGRERSVHIVKGRFTLHPVTHTCLGTCCCVAAYDTGGRLTMYAPTQVPFLYQKDLASVLGMDGGEVRVVQPTIGGAFGSKLDVYPYDVICAHLARITGRPVKLEYTRQEEFRCSPTRQPAIVESEAGCDDEGKLTFRSVHVVLDAGAYISWGATIPYVMMNAISSLYRVPVVDYDTTIVYTNNMYSGAFRGYGNPQGTFVVETQMDELAEKMGMDPLDFRLLNSNCSGDVTPQGMKVTSCGLEDCLKRASERIGWFDRRGQGEEREREPEPEHIKRGVGLASFFHVGGGARVYRSDGCGAVLKINDFGKATLVTGSSEIGQGSETVLAQIVAEELGVDVSDVTVVNTDTDVKPWDVGVHASRTTFIAGNAARIAARKAKEQMIGLAGSVLEEEAEFLDVSKGRVISRRQPDKRMNLGRLLWKVHFRKGGDVIVTEHFYDPPTEMQDRNFTGNISAAYGFGTQAAEVEVDIETGIVRVLRIAVAGDVGRALNPMLLEGQLHGGIVQGIGYAIYEKLLWENGKVLNPTFLDYKIPTAMEVPEILIDLVETVDAEGPYGAKGMAESSLIPTAPAIANAVYDAIGVRFRDLPLTPERVLAGLRDSVNM